MPKIMVVDDSRSQRAVLEEYLSGLKCDIVSCASGQEALFLVVESVPDLIILDVEMPGLSGYDTCRAIRGYLQEHWVPIVYLSANSNPNDLVEGLNAGGDAYITKPVHPDVIKAISKAMLKLSFSQAELLRLNKQLDEVAHFDVLTQVMNRRGYEDMLDRLWKDHQRRHAPLVLMLLDIDHFKKYNDNYGHIKGDECLRSVARVLKDALKRPIDVLARYGGEEFVVLLPDTDLEGAKSVGERLVSAMKAANLEHKFSDTAPYVSVSIGLALANFETGNVEDLLKQADQNLYKAKEAGRNQFMA